MKYIKYLAMFTMAVFTLAACGSGEENDMNNMQENVEESAGDAMNSMQKQFMSTVEGQQETMNKEMDNVESAIEEKGAELEPGLQERWNDLQEQKTEIEEMISNLKSGEFEGFDQIKTDLQDQMTKFKDNLAQLKTDLGMDSM